MYVVIALLMGIAALLFTINPGNSMQPHHATPPGTTSESIVVPSAIELRRIGDKDIQKVREDRHMLENPAELQGIPLGDPNHFEFYSRNDGDRDRLQRTSA